MQRKHWLIALVIAMFTCMTLLFAACGGNGENGNGGNGNTTEVTISLDKSSLQLEEWQSATLVATKTGTTETVAWESSNDEIASVNEAGVVQGNKQGNATITAYAVGESEIDIVVILSY